MVTPVGDTVASKGLELGQGDVPKYVKSFCYFGNMIGTVGVFVEIFVSSTRVLPRPLPIAQLR